jgi:hypothetical protein
MKFNVNWAISGFRGLEHKAGDVIEAAKEEVEHLLGAGVLTVSEKTSPKSMDPNKAGCLMSTEELVAYAKTKFGYVLEVTLTKDAMLAEIASLQGGTEDDDVDSGAPDPAKPVAKMNKAELVAYAKTSFNYDLDPTLSKSAMLTQVDELGANKA